jgi:hypothetical protein
MKKKYIDRFNIYSAVGYTCLSAVITLIGTIGYCNPVSEGSEKYMSYYECKQIIKYTIDSGKTPIIVTSRRTKKSHELLIKDNLQNYFDDRSVWFHSGLGRVNLLNIFNLVDEIFVTEDSSSMISESISTGLHVYTIAPKRVKEDKGHLEMLYLYETIGFIKRLNFDSNFIDCTTNSNLSAKRKKILNLKRTLKAQLLQKLDKLYLIKNDIVAS